MSLEFIVYSLVAVVVVAGSALGLYLLERLGLEEVRNG